MIAPDDKAHRSTPAGGPLGADGMPSFSHLFPDRSGGAKATAARKKKKRAQRASRRKNRR